MHNQETSHSAAAARDRSKLYTPVAIIVAGALIGGGLFFGLSSKGGGDGYAQVPGQKLVTSKGDMEKLIEKNRTDALLDAANAKQGGDRFIGKADAPLTITYWFDYQCPFCQQVEKAVVPTLVTKYVNTGKAKIVFKDYAFLGADSLLAAEYAHAVWDLYPAKFYQWHAAMFDVQDAEGDQGFGDEKTIQTLTSLVPGIDVKAVAARVAQQKAAYDTDIADEQKDGAANGVQGTPAMKIGAQMVDGAQQLSAFEQAIEAQLKK